MNRRADGLASPPHTHRRGGLENHAPGFGSLLWADRDDAPAVPTSRTMAFPSATVSVSGFSTSTSRPAHTASATIRACQ